jgi:hypothetical protein
MAYEETGDCGKEGCRMMERHYRGARRPGSPEPGVVSSSEFLPKEIVALATMARMIARQVIER